MGAVMSETYRAIIRGSTIEWEGDAPNAETPLNVEIKIRRSQDQQQAPNGRKAMAALERIAENGGILSIVDPVAWQREIRKDRPLPGRE